MKITLPRPMKTPTGNVITEAGTYDVISTSVIDQGPRKGQTSYTIKLRGHYAGGKLGSVRLRKFDKIA